MNEMRSINIICPEGMTDISFIAGMQSLETIWLAGNFCDVSAIGALEYVQDLELESPALSDITPLGAGKLLKNVKRLDIVNSEIIPALNTVGIGFENKTVYLPQLLMSAEAAKSAFEVIKASMSGSGKAQSKGKIVIATVEGDIHDIGKNIVKLLLENYGFGVVDLGKDVPAEKIVEKATELHTDIVGLSALMTTTVPSMERTIAMLKKDAPWCKTIVGGAVLTQAYADKIGADYYAKDAMEAVRIAENIIK